VIYKQARELPKLEKRASYPELDGIAMFRSQRLRIFRENWAETLRYWDTGGKWLVSGRKIRRDPVIKRISTTLFDYTQ